MNSKENRRIRVAPLLRLYEFKIHGENAPSSCPTLLASMNVVDSASLWALETLKAEIESPEII